MLLLPFFSLLLARQAIDLQLLGVSTTDLGFPNIELFLEKQL
jgi:hypothetical protein